MYRDSGRPEEGQGVQMPQALGLGGLVMLVNPLCMSPSAACTPLSTPLLQSALVCMEWPNTKQMMVTYGVLVEPLKQFQSAIQTGW